MKGLIQRVSDANVSVDGIRIGQIEHGLLVFLAVEKQDDLAAAEHLCHRVAQFRVFADDTGRMNLNVCEIQGSVLIVPQFTLAADTGSGNRPGFSAAAAPSDARSLYQAFVEIAIAIFGRARVETGQFGADMKVALTNDGPVTFLLETAG